MNGNADDTDDAGFRGFFSSLQDDNKIRENPSYPPYPRSYRLKSRFPPVFAINLIDFISISCEKALHIS